MFEIWHISQAELLRPRSSISCSGLIITWERECVLFPKEMFFLYGRCTVSCNHLVMQSMSWTVLFIAQYFFMKFCGWYYFRFLYAEKFSCHLIIRIPKMAFKDNLHAGAFIAEVCLSKKSYWPFISGWFLKIHLFCCSLKIKDKSTYGSHCTTTNFQISSKPTWYPLCVCIWFRCVAFIMPALLVILLEWNVLELLECFVPFL